MSMPNPAATAARPASTLLCVDDEPNILSALQRLFRPLGYRILTAPGGAVALSLLEREKVDVIISDMRMPQMDGAAFFEQVAKRWPETMRIILTGYADIGSAVAAVNKGGIYRYLSKPWDDNDLRLTVRQALEQQHLERQVQRQNEELRELNTNLENKVRARTEEVRQVFEQVELAYESLKRSYSSAIKVFASMIEMRGGSLAGHGRRVADLARQVAIRMGMSELAAQDVHHAALLHDIGKIGLPDNVIHKPFNNLTAEERANMMKHPVVGQAALMALDPLQEAAKIIRGHHERYDGQGYPDRLQGDQIPLGARVLAVVNDYDSLQNGMVTNERLTTVQARDYLVRESGKRYDPKVVDAIVSLLGQNLSEQEKVPEQAMKSSSLAAGMVLSRDLVTRDGLMLLTRDYVLDGGIIRKIHAYESKADENLVIYVRTDRRG